MKNDMHREAFDFWFWSLMSQPGLLSYNNAHNLPDAKDLEGNWRYGWQAAMRYRDELEKDEKEFTK